MKILGITLIVAAVIALPFLLITEHIQIPVFLAVAGLWCGVAFVLIVGPESISEVAFWKTSIKRDVKAAREIRENIESIREELKRITKLIVEDAYILGSSSFLAMGGDPQAKIRLESNLEQLSEFALSHTGDADKWWDEMHALFPNRTHPKPGSETEDGS